MARTKPDRGRRLLLGLGGDAAGTPRPRSRRARAGGRASPGPPSGSSHQHHHPVDAWRRWGARSTGAAGAGMGEKKRAREREGERERERESALRIAASGAACPSAEVPSTILPWFFHPFPWLYVCFFTYLLVDTFAGPVLEAATLWRNDYEVQPGPAILSSLERITTVVNCDALSLEELSTGLISNSPWEIYRWGKT